MTERFEMRLDSGTIERLDRWAEERDMPSRAEAIRELIDFGLGQTSGKVIRFSHGEKLIMLMLRDLYAHLQVDEAEIDPEFIAKVIWHGHTWAPTWELSGVFHGHEDDPRDVSFVVDVLDMWNFIERAYESLSEEDKARVKDEAAPYGEHVEFHGFDGNNEAGLVGIARFLVDDLGRFSRFRGRDMNAHMPTRERSSRMLATFERLRPSLQPGTELDADQLIELLRQNLPSEPQG